MVLAFGVWSSPPPPPPTIAVNVIMFWQKVLRWASSQLPEMKPDPRTDKMLLMSSAAYPILMITTYVFICVYVGPKLTKSGNKSSVPKFENTIAPFLHVFNIVRVLMNGILGGLLVYFAYYKLDYSILCQSMEVKYPSHPASESQYANSRILHYMWSFLVFKIIDALDIFFLFGLTKNLNGFQLLHHTSALAASWLGVKYLPGGSSVFPVICNCFTGVIVYAFHLTNKKFRPEQKRNAYNFTVFILFMQFTTIFGHSCINYWWDCGYPRWGSGALMIYMVAFLGGLVLILKSNAKPPPVPIRPTNKFKIQ